MLFPSTPMLPPLLFWLSFCLLDQGVLLHAVAGFCNKGHPCSRIQVGNSGGPVLFLSVFSRDFTPRLTPICRFCLIKEKGLPLCRCNLSSFLGAVSPPLFVSFILGVCVCVSFFPLSAGQADLQEKWWDGLSGL